MSEKGSAAFFFFSSLPREWLVQLCTSHRIISVFAVAVVFELNFLSSCAECVCDCLRWLYVSFYDFFALNVCARFWNEIQLRCRHQHLNICKTNGPQQWSSYFSCSCKTIWIARDGFFVFDKFNCRIWPLAEQGARQITVSVYAWNYSFTFDRWGEHIEQSQFVRSDGLVDMGNCTNARLSARHNFDFKLVFNRFSCAS